MLQGTSVRIVSDKIPQNKNKDTRRFAIVSTNLVVNGLDYPTDKSRLSNWSTLLEESYFIAYYP